MNKKFLVIPLIFMLFISSAFAFTTLSVGKVDFKFDENDPSSSAFLLTGVSGYDQSSKIFAGDMSTDEAKATKDVVISIDRRKYSCDYAFVNSQTNYIYTFYVKQKDWFSCENIPLGANEELYGQISPINSPTLDFRLRCIVKVKTYNLGFLSDPKENFELGFEMDNGVEKVQSSLISNTDKSQAVFYNYGKEYATINWAGGGLATGVQCPKASTTAQRALQNINNNNFKMVSAVDYEDYVRKYTALKSSLLILQNENEKSWGSDYDNKLNQILNDVSIDVSVLNNQIIGEYGTPKTLIDNPPYKRLVLDNPFTLPVFTMRINADYVGTIILSGNPKFLSHTPSTLGFKSGTGQTLSMFVENIGSSDGTFIVKADCEGDILTTTDSKLVRKGEVGQFEIFFNSNVIKDKIEQCKVTVRDLQTPNNNDFFTILAHTSPDVEIPDGQKTCIGDKLSYSKDNGWHTLKNCEFGCVKTSETTAECKACAGSECIPPPVKPKTNIFGISILFGLAISIFFVVFISKFIPIKKGKIWILIIIFIVSLLISSLIMAFIIRTILSIPSLFVVG